MTLWHLAGAFIGSAALSWVVVLLSIRAAHHFDAYDYPDGGRKTQSRPIPKLGGVAVAIAFALSAVAVFVTTDNPDELPLIASVLAPALCAAAIGYADDRRSLAPSIRLALQALVGLMAWLLGARIELLGVPVLDALLVILWFMVIINGVNLLDNSDGLAGATVLIAAIASTAIALVFGQYFVALMGASLAGVAVGFLQHNWHPARVYMGDSGAYFLGVLLATLVLRLRPATTPLWVGISIALLLVLLPLLDTAYVVATRLRAGIHPFTAGRDHLSHVLQDRGRPVPVAVLTLQLIALAGALGALGLALVYA